MRQSGETFYYVDNSVLAREMGRNEGPRTDRAPNYGAQPARHAKTPEGKNTTQTREKATTGSLLTRHSPARPYGSALDVNVHSWHVLLHRPNVFGNSATYLQTRRRRINELVPDDHDIVRVSAGPARSSQN